MPDPDAARATIARLIPESRNRAGWAVDIFAAFDALGVSPTVEHGCAVVAIIGQESGFQVDPPVPNLPAVARREIESRAAAYGVPALAVRAAMAIRSPDGRSYNDRVDAARTEKDLSDIYQDFISTVPLGKRLFADFNPIRTAGPMQVGIAYAEEHARAHHYPYPVARSIRDEVFTRRGGLYFGIAHLFDYPAPYDEMLYRFADYNAGHYASRNAAFQNAVAMLAHTSLALDGDLLRHGSDAEQPSRTELALRGVSARLGIGATQLRRDLSLEKDVEFARSRTYARVFELAAQESGRPLPRALVPRIELKSPKITRRLSTAWFAHRVDERYGQCLRRAAGASSPAQ